MGRSYCAAPMRPRHGRWHRPSAGRLHRAVQRPDHSRPAKSRAGLRTVGIPATILPDIAAHLAKHTRPDTNALVFTCIKGGPLRRSGFNKLSGWPHVVTGMGLPGLHVHDLRHTGNTLAADRASRYAT